MQQRSPADGPPVAMRGRRSRQLERRVAAAAALACAVALGGCMPWAAGQTAETVAPGHVAVGAGVSALAPVDSAADVLPQPQAWARTGVARNLDVGLSYAFPATLGADAKLRWRGGPGLALATLAGAGVHGVPIPEFLGLGESRVYWTPFVSAGVIGSARLDAGKAYVATRGFVPLSTGDGVAATLWTAASAGAEWRTGRIRWGPELGVIVPATRPRTAFVLGAVSVRWVSSP